jgi:hypothetical protein
MLKPLSSPKVKAPLVSLAKAPMMEVKKPKTIKPPKVAKGVGKPRKKVV